MTNNKIVVKMQHNLFSATVGKICKQTNIAQFIRRKCVRCVSFVSVCANVCGSTIKVPPYPFSLCDIFFHVQSAFFVLASTMMMLIIEELLSE